MALLGLGLFAIVWENKLRAQFGGAWVTKDLTLLNATFFYVYGLERYVLLVVVVFCSHCLTPLEAELMDNAEVWAGHFQSAAGALLRYGAAGAAISLYALLGASALSANRQALSQALAGLVVVLLAATWAAVG